MIKAIITDLDGTLINTFEANFLAYQETFSKFDIVLDRDFYWNNFGLRIDNLCALLGIYDTDIIQQIKETKADIYPKYFDHLQINEELYNTLLFYKKQGLKLVLSSTASKQNLTNILKHFNMTDLFDMILCGEDVKYGKPNPEIYYKALIQLDVNSNEVIIFEDSNAGLLAACSVTSNVIKVNI